jgi:hypothetical protein
VAYVVTYRDPGGRVEEVEVEAADVGEEGFEGRWLVFSTHVGNERQRALRLRSADVLAVRTTQQRDKEWG